MVRRAVMGDNMKQQQSGEDTEAKPAPRDKTPDDRLRTFIRMFTESPAFEQSRAIDYWESTRARAAG
jgi:hypothetical protein